MKWVVVKELPAERLLSLSDVFRRQPEHTKIFADAEAAVELVKRQSSAFYMHIAVQPPPATIGSHREQMRLQEAFAEIKSTLQENHTQWIDERRYPICLSDASRSECELETHLREGRLHCLVWCARGDG